MRNLLTRKVNFQNAYRTSERTVFLFSLSKTVIEISKEMKCMSFSILYYYWMMFFAVVTTFILVFKSPIRVNSSFYRPRVFEEPFEIF